MSPFAPSRLATIVLSLTLAAASYAGPVQPLSDGASPGTHLRAIEALAKSAYEAAGKAVNAATVIELKQQVDLVFTAVWGTSSDLLQRSGAAAMPGWKTRWQVTYSDFDPAFAERYGDAPPRLTNPEDLGIAGRGRHVRRTLTAELGSAHFDADSRESIERLISSLNNVIGWTRIDDGVTKAERQPRVDLTYHWDAPKAFWQSSADTGWLFEVQAQALNILKTDYAGDLSTAQRHARGLVALIEKCRTGVDANRDGKITAVMMEGGLVAVSQAARQAGLL